MNLFDVTRGVDPFNPGMRDRRTRNDGPRDCTAQELRAYLNWLAQRDGVTVPANAKYGPSGITVAGEIILPMPGYGVPQIVTCEIVDDAGNVMRSFPLPADKSGKLPMTAKQVQEWSGLAPKRKARAKAAPKVPSAPIPAQMAPEAISADAAARIAELEAQVADLSAALEAAQGATAHASDVTPTPISHASQAIDGETHDDHAGTNERMARPALAGNAQRRGRVYAGRVLGSAGRDRSAAWRYPSGHCRDRMAGPLPHPWACRDREPASRASIVARDLTCNIACPTVKNTDPTGEYAAIILPRYSNDHGEVCVKKLAGLPGAPAMGKKNGPAGLQSVLARHLTTAELPIRREAIKQNRAERAQSLRLAMQPGVAPPVGPTPRIANRVSVGMRPQPTVERKRETGPRGMQISRKQLAIWRDCIDARASEATDGSGEHTRLKLGGSANAMRMAIFRPPRGDSRAMPAILRIHQ